MSLLKKQLQTVMEGLFVEFKKSSVYNNPNSNGAIKESFIRKELSERLTKGIFWGKGEIVDSFGHKTGEQDIVGYDFNFVPTFQIHGQEFSTFFVESVICIIEAKSHLTKDAIKDAAIKFDSVNKLQRVYFPTNLSKYQYQVIGVGGFKDALKISTRQYMENIPRVITAIFSFRGVQDGTLEEHLKNINPDADIICILDQGTWVRNSDDKIWRKCADKEDSYYAFLLFLLETCSPHLVRHIYGRVSLAPYGTI